MAELYKTNDGQVFESKSVAEAHQNWLRPVRDNSPEDVAKSNQQLAEINNEYKRVISAFNGGRYDDVIFNGETLADSQKSFRKYQKVLPGP